jgi:DNA-binding SARP family transcriptional activator
MVEAQEIQYGLRFNAYDYEPEMRTSLDLSSDFLSFPNGFSMSFQAQFHFERRPSFGYVFRIIDKKERNIDLVMGEYNVSFSSMPGNAVFKQTIESLNVRPEQWIPIRLDVDTKNAKLRITFGNASQEWKTPEISDFKQVNIVFGKNDWFKNPVIDVPSMTIKDIKIDDAAGNPVYFWKLAKYAGNGVYDELKNKLAKVQNPNWTLNRNTIWKKELTFITENNPQITFNPHTNDIAIATQQFFYRYSLNDNQLRKQAVKRGFSYPLYANQMIYNSLNRNYYAYNLIKEEDGREFACYDSIKAAWDETTLHEHFSDYWHHNRYFSSGQNKLYVFGGYGHHKYKKGMYVYDVKTATWMKETLNGDTIEPRYLSGLGVIDENRLLVFGGFGSKTGNQDLFPQHYYDAYIVDIQTMESKKLWTMETPNENYVVSNSMVVDTLRDCFYALCYSSTKFNTAMRLYKFSISKPECEILADTIPFRFKDSRSYADLFFDRSNNRLISITYSPVEEFTSQCSIYSLAFPPFKKEDLQQTEKSYISLIILILSGLIFLSILTMIIYYKKKAKRTRRDVACNVSTPTPEPEPSSGINTIKSLRKQSISLFGGFQVIDKEGNDVTTEFKPLHKSLFLLILLYTIKNGKGISSVKLKDILWFDKTEESANNNRGVALSKVRQILEQVGKAQFSKQGQYWMVEFGNDIYCDYYEALILIRKMKESAEKNTANINRLLSIVSSGEFLPNMQIEWADQFKSDFSNDLIDLLLSLIQNKELQLAGTVLLDIANVLFIHDPLNEDALKLKCKLLVKMGKNGLAKNAYTAFIKEYQNWFGTNYKYSFDQIIKD